MQTKRPEVLEGSTHRVETPCGALYITLNEYNGKLYEVRLTLGKVGNCARTFLETIAILLSVLLQSNIPREKVKKTLENGLDVNCSNVIWKDSIRYSSCIDLICKLILEELGARNEIKIEEEVT